jgi:hypothetical protein
MRAPAMPHPNMREHREFILMLMVFAVYSSVPTRAISCIAPIAVYQSLFTTTIINVNNVMSGEGSASVIKVSTILPHHVRQPILPLLLYPCSIVQQVASISYPSSNEQRL